MTPPPAPQPLALFRVMARNAVLSDRAATFAATFLGRRSTLSLRDREVVICRVTARCRAEYEWGVHVAAFAADAGFGEAQVRAIAGATREIAALTERDRLLVRMVDALEATADIDDALWSELTAGWSSEQLIELLFLAGWYRSISYVCNAARVPLEAWQRRFEAVAAPPIEEARTMSHYTAETIWERGDASRADFVASRYSRRHVLRFDGGIDVPGSASPSVVPLPYSDPAALDPEEAFVSSLSSCHMLWFLSLAAKQGFCVDRYADAATGVMKKNDAGRVAMTLVTLHPQVEFSGDRLPSRAEVEHLHHLAHEECFIANSVKTEVRCEAVFPA